MTLSIEEWLEERKNHIGASDVAAILGADPRRGPLAVYEAKVTGYSLEDNEWLRYGRDIESAISNMYEVKAERKVKNLGATAFQYHPDIPWLAATLDRVTTRKLSTPEQWAPLELKSVDPYGAKIYPDQWKTDPPLQYLIQLQIQMACTGASWGSLAGLFPGYQLAWHDTERDNTFLDAALPALEEFWDRVQRKDPPPADDLPGTLDVVKRIYSDESGKTVILEPEYITLVDQWEKAKAAKNKAEKEAKSIETHLRSAMKDATFGDLQDGTLLTLKTTMRKGYTVEPKEFRTLRRSKPKGR